MFLMTKKEVDFLYEQFKRMDIVTKTHSLSKKDLEKDMTVFGFNYPPEKSSDDLTPEENQKINIFLEKWGDEFKKIQHDDEEEDSISFDDFLLLFVRLQSNLDWNKKYLPPFYKEKSNYLLEGQSKKAIAIRWKPEITSENPRYGQYVEKQKNKKLLELQKSQQEEKIKELEKEVSQLRIHIEQYDGKRPELSTSAPTLSSPASPLLSPVSATAAKSPKRSRKSSRSDKVKKEHTKTRRDGKSTTPQQTLDPNLVREQEDTLSSPDPKEPEPPKNDTPKSLSPNLKPETSSHDTIFGAPIQKF